MTRGAVRFVLYGVAAILMVKAVDISPIDKLFNGSWLIPFAMALALVYFAPKIEEKLKV